MRVSEVIGSRRLASVLLRDEHTKSAFFQREGRTYCVLKHRFLDCPRGDKSTTLPFSFVLKSGGREAPESLDAVTQLNVS